MLDLKFVQKNKGLVERSIIERGIKNADLNYLFSLDNKRKELLNKLDSLRKKKKIMTQAIESLVTMNKKVNPTNIEMIKSLNDSIKNYEKELVSYEQKIKEFLTNLPNIPHHSVPQGLPGKPDKIVRRWGEKPKFCFSPCNYLEIGEKLEIIDFSKSVPILGLM